MFHFVGFGAFFPNFTLGGYVEELFSDRKSRVVCRRESKSFREHMPLTIDILGDGHQELVIPQQTGIGSQHLVYLLHVKIKGGRGSQSLGFTQFLSNSGSGVSGCLGRQQAVDRATSICYPNLFLLPSHYCVSGGSLNLYGSS